MITGTMITIDITAIPLITAAIFHFRAASDAALAPAKSPLATKVSTCREIIKKNDTYVTEVVYINQESDLIKSCDIKKCPSSK